MRKIKIIKKLFVTFLLTLTICTSANIFISEPLKTEAHSGRTDKRGGHKDNKNKSGLGSYHYHCGGHPAHLHKNGICPYANSTSSTKNTNSFSSNNSYSTKSKNYNNTEQNVSNQSSGKQSSVVITDTSYDNVAFNASYYANKHSDVYKAYGDSAKDLYNHFIKNGIYEGRQSSEQFCITVYKDNNQDLIDAFGDDLIKYYNHYIEFGVNENRVSK